MCMTCQVYSFTNMHLYLRTFKTNVSMHLKGVWKEPSNLCIQPETSVNNNQDLWALCSYLYHGFLWANNSLTQISE